MYEIIAKNKRKSVIIFFAMGLILILLGAVSGALFDVDPLSGRGVFIGIAIAVALWGIQALVAFTRGSEIVLNQSNAVEISKKDDPELYNIIEELSVSSRLPMPKVYLIETPSMNAFASGTKINKSVVAVTSGLRNRLSRYELQAVMAHEMSHIFNRDVMYMTFASIMLGTIVLIAGILKRVVFYSGGRHSNSKGGNGLPQIIIMVVAVVVMLLAAFFARLFYFSLSRKREYLADTMAVKFTQDPGALAAALEKISGDNSTDFDPGEMTAAMCISKPKLKEKMSLAFSTHPPIEKRIAILRAMERGTTYEAYCKAYQQVMGKNDLPKDKHHSMS